jgi:putative ABC transport system permease protein
VVYKQLMFAKNRPVGYKREGLVNVLMNSQDYQGQYEVLRNELKNTGVVTEMALSSSPLTDIWNTNGGFDWEGKDPGYIAEFGTFTVTPTYGSTVGWQFVEGRDFSAELASDSSAFVINEAAAKVLGYKNPVGQRVRYKSWWTNGTKEFQVIGVVKDQVMRSPYDPATPSVFFIGGATNWITIRMKAQTPASEAIKGIEKAFNKVIPNVPVQYKFADQEYALKFAAEERIGVLAAVFASLAIFISCLGLFALAAFVAETRTKEIGIRKVVGATVFNLWSMLSANFVVLVAISCIVAMPLAYYLMDNWLGKYTYHTELSWWVFATTGFGALAITLFTVSIQAVKAALMNPVKSLRSE